MEKPKIFISSTIYDFHDLRSAIKYYLEENGFYVMASEFNDFIKPINQHSYDSCTEAIKEWDYFLLLIGSRVGGWYNESTKISITQQEYRTAYELQNSNKIKIINFIRSDVWNVRSDRKEFLKKFTSISKSIDKTDFNSIETKLLGDYDFINNFLLEIGKNTETKEALINGNELPKSNWIHQFTTYRDIIDVLNIELLNGIPVSEILQRTMLKNEIIQIIKRLTFKFDDGRIGKPKHVAQKMFDELDVNVKDVLNDYTNITKKTWSLVSYLSVHLLGNDLNLEIIPNIIINGIFMKYDKIESCYTKTELQNKIELLYSEVKYFQKIDRSQVFGIILNCAHSFGNKESTSIKTVDLLSVMSAYLKWSNMIEISENILKYLDTNKWGKLEIFPHSPIKGKQLELDKNSVSEEDINKYILGKA